MHNPRPRSLASPPVGVLWLAVAVLVLSGGKTLPDPNPSAEDSRLTLKPWLETLESYPGYLSLARQSGYRPTLKVVKLIETSGHPEMIRALIEVESNWRVRALSHRDARGLMQIRPIAALEVDPDLDPDELFDPVVNVRTGIRIFEEHMEYFLGYDDPEHWALTSYNRGRHATFELGTAPPVTSYSRRVLEITSRM